MQDIWKAFETSNEDDEVELNEKQSSKNVEIVWMHERGKEKGRRGREFALYSKGS